MDRAQVKKTLNYANVGEAIDHELAAKMVKDFQDSCPADAIKSYTIGKKILELILAQPGCVALKFYNAIDENGNQTLVYVGLDKNGNNIIEYPFVNEKGKLGTVEAYIGDRTMGDGTPVHSWFGS